MDQAQAKSSFSRTLDDSLSEEELQRSWKRARLSSSGTTACSDAPALAGPSGSCARYQEAEDDIRTPEYQASLTHSLPLKATGIKTEPVERWIEIEAQYTDASSDHEVDAASPEFSSGLGGADSSALNSVLEAADEATPGRENLKGAEMFRSWPAEWETALLSQIISDPMLRSWAKGGSSTGMTAALAPLTRSIEGLKPRSVHRKATRMRYLASRFYDQLTPAGKSTPIEEWSQQDLKLLGKYESHHVTKWLRSWFAEFSPGIGDAPAVTTAPPISAASCPAPLSRAPHAAAAPAAVFSSLVGTIPASTNSPTPFTSLVMKTPLSLEARSTRKVQPADALLQDELQRQAHQLAQLQATSAQQTQLLAHQAGLIAQQSQHVAALSVQVSRQSETIKALERRLEATNPVTEQQAPKPRNP